MSMNQAMVAIAITNCIQQSQFSFRMPIQIVKRTVNTVLSYQTSKSSDQTRFRFRQFHVLQSYTGERKTQQFCRRLRVKRTLNYQSKNYNPTSIRAWQRIKNNLSSYWQVQTPKDKIILEDREITTTFLVKQSVSVTSSI